jgi:hypothetical protein
MTEGWAKQLQDYIAVCRAAFPLPNREDLTPIEEWQCRIVGGSLLSWLREHVPRILQERAVLSKLLALDPEPFVVFTSNLPGLVAAREIIGQDQEAIGYLLEDEYASPPLLAADNGFRSHIHVWSYFPQMVGADFESAARTKHAIAKECTFWEHDEGTMWATNAGRGAAHLWQWDGEKPELLEEAFTSWIA